MTKQRKFTIDNWNSRSVKIGQFAFIRIFTRLSLDQIHHKIAFEYVQTQMTINQCWMVQYCVEYLKNQAFAI